MEHGDRAPVATFHAPELREAATGLPVVLGEAVAHHARVKRLQSGDLLRLTDGAGARALAAVRRIGKRSLEAELLGGTLEVVAPPPPVHLFLPVADRERMLWLAEKCAELALTRWCPVMYQRSRSVSPRGEGGGFRDRVRARMVAALEQSGGAWLPVIDAERPLAEVLGMAELPAERWLLDAGGEPPFPGADVAPAGGGGAIAIALGPEGGLEPAEREQFVAGGWRPVRLASTILRFETAGIAALALARAVRSPASTA